MTALDPAKWSAEFAGQLRELANLVESQKAGVVAVDSRFDSDGLKLKIEFMMAAQHTEAMPRFRTEQFLGAE